MDQRDRRAPGEEDHRDDYESKAEPEAGGRQEERDRETRQVVGNRVAPYSPDYSYGKPHCPRDDDGEDTYLRCDRTPALDRLPDRCVPPEGESEVASGDVGHPAEVLLVQGLVQAEGGEYSLLLLLGVGGRPGLIVCRHGLERVAGKYAHDQEYEYRDPNESGNSE